MELSTVLNKVKILESIGSMDISVNGVNMDSRLVQKGNLFVAVCGTQTDGHQYIPKAIELGARVVVCQTRPDNRPADVTFIRVEDTEDAIGKIATMFYGDATK